MSQETRIYRGAVTVAPYGENDDALYLLPADEPLAAVVESDLEELGQYLSVRYWVAESERPVEELEDNLVKVLVGAGEADYGSAYSEITGYLWTTAELVVGGHDLLAELESYAGQFVHLEIRYSSEPEGTPA